MYIKSFDELSKSDSDMAGGKGASLGEMTKAGLPVPPGFVILATAFDEFLEASGLNSKITAILKNFSQENASHKIRGLIEEAKITKDLEAEVLNEFNQLKAKFVAVRSSATLEDNKTASWAGELETFLNVTKHDLTKSILKCWSSLFTPRAIFYRYEKKLNKRKISVAIVVQKMVQSKISGVCFTVHPVAKDKNLMVIEAGFGLGESVVSGLITPDTYIVKKNNLTITNIAVSVQKLAIILDARHNLSKKLDPKTGGKQKLPKRQIIELAKICKNIEKHYKSPQDIEWAYQGGKFYITQARPITTL
ncbi:MAG: PEP/pyruvate-binding domain-containing protein [Patescibacteria group bacterium]